MSASKVVTLVATGFALGVLFCWALPKLSTDRITNLTYSVVGKDGSVNPAPPAAAPSACWVPEVGEQVSVNQWRGSDLVQVECRVTAMVRRENERGGWVVFTDRFGKQDLFTVSPTLEGLRNKQLNRQPPITFLDADGKVKTLR